ncbi:hypothetical protein BC629DRAFT_1134957 [Irpex lacteus]|nr:hypothetical protein BC629DRAFT_1134957 [Irpex lacteus]
MPPAAQRADVLSPFPPCPSPPHRSRPTNRPTCRPIISAPSLSFKTDCADAFSPLLSVFLLPVVQDRPTHGHIIPPPSFLYPIRSRPTNDERIPRFPLPLYSFKSDRCADVLSPFLLYPQPSNSFKTDRPTCRPPSLCSSFSLVQDQSTDGHTTPSLPLPSHSSKIKRPTCRRTIPPPSLPLPSHSFKINCLTRDERIIPPPFRIPPLLVQYRPTDPTDGPDRRTICLPSHSLPLLLFKTDQVMDVLTLSSLAPPLLFSQDRPWTIYDPLLSAPFPSYLFKID